MAEDKNHLPLAGIESRNLTVEAEVHGSNASPGPQDHGSATLFTAIHCELRTGLVQRPMVHGDDPATDQPDSTTTLRRHELNRGQGHVGFLGDKVAIGQDLPSQ